MFPVLFGRRRRASAWNPGRLPGTPREWLAGPDWCFTDGSAAFTAASSQSLSVASNTGLQTGNVDFWFAGWQRLGGLTNNAPVAGKANDLGSPGTTENLLYYSPASSRYRMLITDGSGYTWVNSDTFGAPTTGVWYFVVGYYNSTNGTLGVSVNGGAFDTASTGGMVPLATSLAFRVGGTGTAYFTGNVASVAFGKSPSGGIASVATTIRDRLYASGAGIVYADTTSAERTAWGLVSWWDLVRSGNFTDSHGSNNLTNNNGVGYGGGLPRARAGDTDPVAAWVDRWQGTLVTQSDPLRRPTLRLVSGKWVVRFDGVNDVLTAGDNDFITGAALTAFSRFSSSSIPRYASIVSKQYNFNGYALAGDWTAFGTGKISFNSKTAAYAVSDSSLATGLPTTAIGANDGTTSRLFVGDTLQSVTAAAGGTMPNTSDEVCIGGGGNAGVYGQFWTGDIASVGLNPADLTAGDRALLAAYLAGVM